MRKWFGVVALIAAVAWIVFVMCVQAKAAATTVQVMVFTQANCPGCKRMEPLIKAFQAQGFRLVVKDVFLNPSTTAKYNVTGTPTFVAVDDAGRQVDREDGTLTVQRLGEMFKK